MYHAINTPIIGKNKISKETKMKIKLFLDQYLLTCGCIVTNKLRNKIQAAEMKYIKRVQGATRLDRIKNVKSCK